MFVTNSIGKPLHRTSIGVGQFFIADLVVLLLLSGCLQTLPQQTAPREVLQYVAQRFDVVAATLLDAEVGIDAGVSGAPRQVLLLPVGMWMLVCRSLYFFANPKSII